MTPIKFVYEASSRKSVGFHIQRTWPNVPRTGEIVTLAPYYNDERTFDLRVEHVRYQNDGGVVLHLSYLGEREPP